jgi:hypothetical protein
MSGGPTITAGGLVVGINVSTAGNELKEIEDDIAVDPAADH